MIEIKFGTSNQVGLKKQLVCKPYFIGQDFSYAQDFILEGAGDATTAGNILEGREGQEHQDPVSNMKQTQPSVIQSNMTLWTRDHKGCITSANLVTQIERTL